MRKALTTISALAFAAGIFLPNQARAEDPQLTLRASPGVAIPLSSPQTDRFNVGAAVAVKPTLTLLPWFDVHAAFSAMGLPSKLDGINFGQTLGLGLGARVKRSHGESNTDTGFSAVSPWFDVDGQYVRTGPLDRFMWSAAVGASVPTSDSRNLWVGPFVRYVDVVDSLNARPLINSNDAQLLIVGLSFEYGPSAKKKEPVKVSEPAPCPKVPVVEKKEEPKKEEPKPVPVVFTVDAKVQFPFDSSVPLPEGQTALGTVLQALLAHPGYSVTVEGHASSEGRVAYNEKLAVRRAEYVADYLKKNGVPANNLTVKGFGSRVPVASNDTEEGRVQNRRVEFSVKVTLTKEGSK